MENKDKDGEKRPRSLAVIGMVIGTGLGLLGGLLSGNVSLGLAAGMCLGLLAGGSVDTLRKWKANR